MAGSGTVIGSSFSDLAEIIALVNDKSRIGVCLDTCHIFAAGYDIRSREAFQSTLARFDAEIGLGYLKALHLNDSKTPLGSRLDRHANIGTGFLGLGAFWNFMNEPRFEGLPMVLETPAEDAEGKEDRSVYAREVKLLESLVGMDRDGEEFGALEADLARKGESDRKIAMEKFELKEKKAAKEKAKKPGAKANGKGKSKGKGKGNPAVGSAAEERSSSAASDTDVDELSSVSDDELSALAIQSGVGVR
jgi:AP endonuclease-1